MILSPRTLVMHSLGNYLQVEKKELNSFKVWLQNRSNQLNPSNPSNQVNPKESNGSVEPEETNERLEQIRPMHQEPTAPEYPEVGIVSRTETLE